MPASRSATLGTALRLDVTLGLGTDPGTLTNIEIVGVVNDTRYESLRDELPLTVFLCTAQHSDQIMTAYVRTAHDPENEFQAIRSAVRELEPNLPITNMKTLDTPVDESLSSE